MLFVCAGLFLFALGCEKPATEGAPPADSSAAAAAPPSSPPPSVEQAAAPADLDVAAIKKGLKCASDAKSGPCFVVNAFASCTSWDPIVPSGDGRWIGTGHRVEDGKTVETPTILRARRVPANEVATGQIPVKIGLAEIGKEEGSAYSQAEKVIRALARADVPAKSNPALEYLKRLEQWPEGYAVKTTGGQVFVAAHGGTFVCQGPKRQLYVVQRAATRGAGGDGLYAELWAATW